MAKLIYSAIASADGYVEDAAGNFDWAAPDEELHRFVNDLERPVGTYLYGRRMYETMLYWETAHTVSGQPSSAQEFTRIWQAAEKIVFSKTLDRVEGNTRLASAGVVEEVARLKEEPGGDLAVGGAGLASELIERNLIDDYHVFICPILLGGGTPYFPAMERRIRLELLERRTFSGLVEYLHYARV